MKIPLHATVLWRFYQMLLLCEDPIMPLLCEDPITCGCVKIPSYTTVVWRSYHMPLLCEDPIICHCVNPITCYCDPTWTCVYVESPSHLQSTCVMLYFQWVTALSQNPPVDALVSCRDVNNLYRRCSVTCNDGKTFLRPVPKFFSCGPMGLWNTDSPMDTFHFPACGGKCTNVTPQHLSQRSINIFMDQILVKALLLSFI